MNKMISRLEFYASEELKTIITHAAEVLKIKVSDTGAEEIAKRARGTPRVANRLLRRVRDYAQVKGDGSINKEIAEVALKNLEIDELGLDKVDRKILSTIIDKFGGGPVGIDTLSAAIAEETQTIEDVYEPYLMQIGFIDRTPRGRIAAENAYKHLGTPFGKPKEQAKLWQS